jgi:hypothetical protein
MPEPAPVMMAAFPSSIPAMTIFLRPEIARRNHRRQMLNLGSVWRSTS